VLEGDGGNAAVDVSSALPNSIRYMSGTFFSIRITVDPSNES